MSGMERKLFILHPRDKKEMVHLLEYNDFSYPVCLDIKGSFDKINKIPSNLAFQTFLLDNRNKVIAIGNPIHNPNVRTLYLNLILSDSICESKAESPGYFNKDIAIYCNVPSSPVYVKLSGKAQ